MSGPPQSPEPAAAPHQAVSAAIQDLTAARLGRGFVPLAILAVTGMVEMAVAGVGSGPMLLGLGAIGAAAAMLAYGLRVTQHTFGREEPLWMRLAMLGSLAPPGFALYVLAWRGLRGFVAGGGGVAVIMAVYFALMGLWAMRGWMRVVEVERLAKVMAMDPMGGER